MNHYLFSENIINIGNNENIMSTDANHKYCFSILAGNLLLNNSNIVESINILNNENVDFFSNTNTLPGINFETIAYHNSFYNAFNKDVTKLCVGSIFQSMIYFMYNVTETYDFYNHPELIEENGFISNSNVSFLNNIEKIIIDNTIIKIKDRNIFNLCTRIHNSDSSKKNQSFLKDDILWVKYNYDLQLLDDIKQIYFLIGWKIKYNVSNNILLGKIHQNNEYKIEVYENLSNEKLYTFFSTKTGSYELKIDNVTSYEYLYLIAKSTTKSEYTYKNILKIGDKNYYDTNVITTLAFSLCNTVDKFANIHKFYEYQNILLSKFIYTSIIDLYIYLDIYIYYTIAYISNHDNISSLLALFIYEQENIIDLKNINIIKLFLEFVENKNGLINSKEKIINSIWNSLQITNTTTSINEIFYNLQNIQKETKIYTSSYIFDYGLDFVQKNTANVNYPIDFIISSTDSNIFKLIKNDFLIKWNNTIPSSINSSNIQFILNSTEWVNIVCNSKRTKKYAWIKESNHSMNTLLKGLFGEMLSKTRIVPVEKTNNNLGEDGNEPYTDYVTTKSLTRSLIQSPESYFIEQHDEAILQLQIYYQNLWNNDNNALYNLLDTNKELNIGDIIEIPINISMKYNISNPWSTSLDNNEQRSVEGKWAFLYKFIIH